IVHSIDMVAGEHENDLVLVLGHELEVLVDRIGRARVPIGVLSALVRLEQPHAADRSVQIPRSPDADVVVQRMRSVLGEDGDIIDARIDAVAQREVDDAVLPAEGYGWLRTLSGEN